MTDADLIPRLRAGEPAALTQAYQQHSPPLLVLATRLLGRDAEAQDLLQDLFIGLPDALVRYEERGQFAAWLRRIVVRLALMRLRAEQRRPRTMTGVDELVSDTAAHPIDRLTLTAGNL